MSWDQGIQLREDMDPKLIEAIEKQFEERMGYHKDVEYVTWFGLGEELIFDFGLDQPVLKLNRK